MNIEEPSNLRTQRFPRRSINGTDAACAWQVNAAGSIYKNRRLQAIGNDIAGLPTIDFGIGRYAGGKGNVPGYFGPIPPAGVERNSVRLVDEIVCLAFHGFPSRRLLLLLSTPPRRQPNGMQ